MIYYNFSGIQLNKHKRKIVKLSKNPAKGGRVTGFESLRRLISRFQSPEKKNGFGPKFAEAKKNKLFPKENESWTTGCRAYGRGHACRRSAVAVRSGRDHP